MNNSHNIDFYLKIVVMEVAGEKVAVGWNLRCY